MSKRHAHSEPIHLDIQLILEQLDIASDKFVNASMIEPKPSELNQQSSTKDSFRANNR
ncbi:hypothetical protein [Paenibacillus sp. YYML68]|uniref:hypothetical protein n=1 Tax=Paenibacillus sp. YYML68 TaxID=2909250 RepID=UPI002490B555|nr:hypothetical protein [Paenibacillus sp. YYML68]